MKIAIAQMNSHIGNFEWNFQKIIKETHTAKKNGADIIVFPELALCGYPPMDLLDKPYFWEKNDKYIKKLKETLPQDIGVILGSIRAFQYNTAYFFYKGKIQVQDKTLLPTYDVFDEKRYFKPAQKWEVFTFKGKKIYIAVCEDIWDGYEENPYHKISKFDIIINISASPFEMDKLKKRIFLLSDICFKNHCCGIYANTAGANDELIFDGRSFVVNDEGKVVFIGEEFKEDLYLIDLNQKHEEIIEYEDSESSIYNALATGIKDYFFKNGFSKAVLGLSGGIDSAVVCALAVEALGRENVTAILLPGPYSSEHSVKDALNLAAKLGIPHHIVSIKESYHTMLDSLEDVFKGTEFDLTEENIQSRLRGNAIMSYSNKFDSLALNTGNKSELAVGYCTLYGDMIGGLAVIGDLYKTQVYELAKYINRKEELIPRETIIKPPSAELRPDQTDQDDLPDYDVLDHILFEYLELNKCAEEIIEKHGYNKKVVDKIIRKVFYSEYKRRQSPIVLKVSSKAFGSGRRIPITNEFK